MIRYSITIFLGAFLLFQVQPLIARFILPWFGGTAAVWTTCMMFFQVLLLLGYLYAHLLRKLCTPIYAWAIHVALMASAVVLTSVVPSEALKPAGDENLTLAILRVLALSIGLPFFTLSATGPLVQAWQSTSHVSQSPYRLYALSNLGSMLALISYPFLVERFFPLLDQALYWTLGFFVFTAFCCFSGWQTLGFASWANGRPEKLTTQKKRESGCDEESKVGVSVVSVGCWALLSMAASIVLLATTNLLCQEVASVPFLWILPLVLYLFSFIICFDRPALYRRRIFAPLLIVSAILSIGIVHLDVLAGLSLQIAGLSTVCFAASMICHGELERLKPDSKFLTTFYLWVSVGGALGGVFVCVVAPNLFDGFFEFHVGLIIALLVALVAIMKVSSSEQELGSKKMAGWALAMGVFIALGAVACSLMYFLDPSYHEGVVFRSRNEYGLLSVIEEDETRRFVNGRIDHGVQSTDPNKLHEELGYYVDSSGVGVAFNSLRDLGDKGGLESSKNLKVGVIGLGAGAMASWLKPGDKMVFYEINPMVEEVANKYFNFLSGSQGDCEVVLGDGRICIQNELRNDDFEKYDLLFLDAFSSDSIPVHLLTSEAFELYLNYLEPDGILVCHISNRFIDIRPVLLEHSKVHGLTPILIDVESAVERPTRWVLLTKNQEILSSSFVTEAKREWPADVKPIKWTDDFASVAALLNWSVGVDWQSIEKSQKAKASKRAEQESSSPIQPSANNGSTSE